MKSTKRRNRLLFGIAISAISIATAVVIRRKEATQTGMQPATTGPGYFQAPFWQLYDRAAEAIDQRIGWDKLPLPLGLAVLVGLRDILRQKNLYDTSNEPAINRPPVGPMDPRYLISRTADGTYNDLDHPEMGMAGSRFGRNVPIKFTYPASEQDILAPNPRTVSRELLTRDTFQPATTLNALAAAWLQFMIRDWFSHGPGDKNNPWQIPLRDDDPWHQHPMTIMRTRSDPTHSPESHNMPPTYINTETHWWDASQIYGSTKEFQDRVRTHQDGKLILSSDGLLELPSDPSINPAMTPGWWLGLEMMQILFMREHNSICDRLRAEYPHWSDDDIFERARLINAALMAKIHTVEWTPAIISHPTTQAALKANWWGLEMERLNNIFGRLINNDVISGIPGSETNHFGVPYALTEEFVAVYRMHPLIPDDYSFRSVEDDRTLQTRTLREIAGPHAQEVIDQISMTDLFYSFGTSHPGAITLHNHPRFLQTFERPDGIVIDLASTDILRTRELGVPRYNEFRRLLHLAPATSFEELTDNPVWAAEIRRVYNNDIESVDLMVGLYAEKKPVGFAFSDTAFRIFILMASRRLNSDRFFTVDFTPRVYTQAGIDWIKNNDMGSILLRHYPHLRPAMRRVGNAFTPWAKSTS